MKFKCQCCGIEADYIDGESAYMHGWDAAPYFRDHVTCNLCPAVCVILGAGHTKAHAHWAEHGRPENFGPLCVVDDQWGINQATMDEQAEGVKAWIEKIKTGETEQ